MSKIFKLFPLLILMLMVSSVVFSQSVTPNSGDIFEETNDVPIDGAIALLTVAGIGLGVKKLYARRK